METFSMNSSALSIKTRLVASFAGILLLAIAAAGTGYWGIASLGTFMVDTLHGDVALAQAAGDIRSGALQLRRFEKDVFINATDAESVTSYANRWHAARKTLDASVARANDATQDKEIKSKLSELTASIDSYSAGFERVRGQIVARTITTTQQANQEMDQYKTAVRKTDELAEEISTIAIERAAKVEGTVESKRTTVIVTLMTLTAAGLVAAFLPAWTIIRAITAPLASAVSVASSVAAGKLGNNVTIARRDEFGQLLQALQDMDGKLYDIVHDMRVTSDKVSSATREIAAGNDDLSQRTQEQASSLEQTAASIEEMTASVQQNASNASQASELARSACKVAEHGGTVVQKVVGAMTEISGSSNRIASIVGVIDDIAFQTNLLALNAAVEAARAGEQGRGFAVVATEVRNLAQRSATAAKEIKSLINESVDKVKAGAELVANSGQALAEIVTSVKKVSSVVESIATANDQQASGIQQINHAITQLDDMTQQNAAAVEEIAAVSKSLQDQAESLASKAMHFKLSGADTTPRSEPVRIEPRPKAAPPARSKLAA
jgi:methyl-accepting chemotaxis protein